MEEGVGRSLEDAVLEDLQLLDLRVGCLDPIYPVVSVSLTCSQLVLVVN